MRKLGIAAILLASLWIVGSAFGHHAAAGIDPEGSVTVKGVVTEFRWANPHSWIEMDVVNPQGVTQSWNFEMNPPSYLVRAGWTRSTLKPGDEVTVTARPFRNGDPGGLFLGVKLPDGKELSQRAGR